MSDETSKNVNTTLFSALATICILLSGFTLTQSFDANAERKATAVQMEHMNKAIEELSKKSELDKKQDGQLSKHWKLHSWTKREIDAMRFKAGDGPSEWPDLGGPSDWE